MLSSKQKFSLQMLIKGERAPANGMEIHFLQVIRGKAMVATKVEMEWFQYWQRFVSQEERNDPSNISSYEELEEIFNNASGGRFLGCFERDVVFGGKWSLDFYFREVRLGIEIFNENPVPTDVLLKQIEREQVLDRLHIQILRLSDKEIFGDPEKVLSKFYKAWKFALNSNASINTGMKGADKTTRRIQTNSAFGGGWTTLEQGEKHKGDGYFVKVKVSEGIAGDRDANKAMRRSDWLDMKKRSRGD